MRKSFLTFTAAAALAVAWPALGPAAENKAVAEEPAAILAADTSQHRGLAARYPGDQGLANDSAVVLFEDFETGAINELGLRWTEISNKDRQVLDWVMESPSGSPGRRSLRMTATRGHDEGGHLWKLLDQGYDRLYARFYVKFAPDAPFVHHFVFMGGTTSTEPWPSPGAGSRPNGSDLFNTGIDLLRNGDNPPGDWTFYSYWPEMHSWQTPEGVGDGRPAPYYGNLFRSDSPLRAPRGQWQCVEIMIKLNTPPDGRDGEQAFWVDGRLMAHWYPGSHTGTWLRDKFHTSGEFNTNPQPFAGFMWRKTDQLKINTFWLEYYLASIFEEQVRPSDPSIPYNLDKARVQFDNVVLATRYIGPISGGEPVQGQSRMDYDGDGELGAADVIRLLRLRVNDPRDMRADYDGDGYPTLLDALALLLDIYHARG